MSRIFEGTDSATGRWQLFSLLVAAAVIFLLPPSSTRAASAGRLDDAYRKGMAFYYRGRLAQSRGELLRALATGQDPNRLGFIYLTLGEIAQRQHRIAEAEKYLRKARSLFAKHFWVDHPMIFVCDQHLVRSVFLQSRYPEAESLARQLLNREIRAYGQLDRSVFDTRLLLLECHEEQREFAEARKVCQGILIHQEKRMSSPALLSVQLHLVRNLAELGECEKAEENLIDVMRARKSFSQGLAHDIGRSAFVLAECSERNRSPARALRWARQTVVWVERSGCTHDSELHFWQYLRYLARLLVLEDRAGQRSAFRATAVKLRDESWRFSREHPASTMDGVRNWTVQAQQALSR